MNHQLLAKPNELLATHLITTLENAKSIIRQLQIENIIDEDLKKAGLIASAFHDIGKADKRFQRYLQSKKGKISHGILGLPILNDILNQLIFPNNYKKLILLSVATHHSKFTGRLFENYPRQRFELDKERYDKLNQIINNILSSLGYEIHYDLKNSIKNFKNTKELFIKAKAISGNADQNIRRAFVFIKGLLMESDYFASARVKIKQYKYCKKILKNPYSYQKKASSIKGNVFITLPTGTGKTETALYWAMNNYRGKLVYVLPTNVSINKMYLRLKKIFHKANVAFYHSNYEQFVYQLRQMGEDESYENILFAKNLTYPINITTPDQLILALLNYKRYELKNFSLFNALIVLDEIHIYGAETFALIKNMIKYLQRYNTNFCIMSATFPEVIKRELGFIKAQELLPKDKIMEIYKKRKRTKFVLERSRIQDTIDDMLKDLKNGKKVLVILNTVKRAQEVYKQLKEKIDNVYLIHSKFTFRDRYKIENQLDPLGNQRICKKSPYKRPHILVATQIVEVSLNIDYDTLYTEAASMDSLIQRAGRVNRFNKKRQAIVHIFKPESHYPYSKEMIDETLNILENSKLLKNEWDYLRMTNKYYENIWESIKSDEDRYNKVWKEMSYIFAIDFSNEENKKIKNLLQTRSNMISIPAVPLIYKEKINDINSKIISLKNTISQSNHYKRTQDLIELIEEKKSYFVNVPIYFGKYISTEDKDVFITLDYDPEIGLMDIFDNFI